jgi:integrase
MSDRKVSRAQYAYPYPTTELRTWLDVKKALPRVSGLNTRKCADYISALNSIGNLNRLPGETKQDVDLALARMEADPRLVTKYLNRMQAAKNGLKGDSWHNVTSRVRRSMEVTGAGRRIGIRGRPVADQRYYMLPELPYQAALATLMHWMEAESISLDQLTAADLERFGLWLAAVPDMRASPRVTLLAAVRALRNAAKNFPEFWPPTFLLVKSKFEVIRYALPWSAFAPSFHADAEVRTAFVIDPPLNDPDARDAIEKRVAKHQEYEIRRLASALCKRTGRDPKTITAVADLVELPAYGEILQFLFDRVRQKDPKAMTSGGLFNTANFLCNLAANWVKVPDNHLKMMRKIAHRRDPNPAARGEGSRKVRRKGMTRKSRDMLGHFRDPQVLARLLDLPAAMFQRILKRLKKFGRLKRGDAVVLSWAFAVALLQIAPVRPKNGSGIVLKKNLFEQGKGASRRVFVHWQPEEVKNGVELQFELTGEVLELFDLYMKHGRPLLCSPSNLFLFPGRGDTSKQTSWFSTQIAENLKKELGVRVTGQQFRHLIAFVYLLENPGDYETVRQFLGHTDVATTVAYYAGIEMKDAAAALDATVKNRRNELASKAKRSLRSRRA